MEKFIQNIANIADGQESRSFRREFTDKEMVDLSRENMNRGIEKRRLRAEIRELTKEIKKIDKEGEEFLDRYVSGAEEKIIKAFYTDDDVTRFRTYYDAEGNLIGERKLRPDEGRQLSLRSAMNE